ncbi:flavoprotein [Streptomyces sp. NRRL F-4489]|uniref:flavoprotein n=1 Tax=Streptomyces sp. NRRL F-4489 TaxID=1609095 RepID=UPI00074A1153|nr:flavoprotein [Streptomyces sp. NRRL F-4489]KUL35679.1 flavoprotein [Streptomyces sp. NRRL F-4489]
MTRRPVLYVFGSAAPPVREFPDVVRRAQAEGYEVCVGLTPTAARWLGGEVAGLAEATGHPVRSAYKLPGEPDVWPRADAILVAPATFNTLNHWALGLTEHFIVGVVAEGIGKEIPLVTMPCVNSAYVRHPQFGRSLATLREAGVEVLYGPGGFVPHRSGERRADGYPWDVALGAVARVLGGRR